MMPVTQQYGPGINGNGTPISLDYMPASQITVTADFQGAGTATVQVTQDDVFDQNAPNYVPEASASWFALQLPAGTVWPPLTGNAYAQFPGPWRAVRVVIAANDLGAIITIAQATTPRA